jgi:hypothetical protein
MHIWSICARIFRSSVAVNRRGERSVVVKPELVDNAPGIADLRCISVVASAQPPQALVVERADR